MGSYVFPRGKLWWDSSALADMDDGYNGAHIIEVLTQNVSDVLLAHLQKKGVSYLFGGNIELNLDIVVQKLKRLFGIERLLLEGGGIVNGSFLQEGLIDEISLVIVPEAECSEKAVSLFETGKYQSGNKALASFQLKEAKRLNNDGLRLIYQK